MNNTSFNYSLPDEETRNKIIKEMIDEYPFLNHGVLSKSLCARDIDYIQIGNKSNCVLYSAGFHGMEWLTSLLLLHFIKKLCFAIEKKITISDINIVNFLKRKGAIFVPCVNPDGVEISVHGVKAACDYKKIVCFASEGDTSHWQANARGVDINHNFDAGWEELHKLEIESGISCPSPTRYGGALPESEPETRALTGLCRSKKFRYAFAFHSQGEEIYWNYGDKTPLASEAIAKILSISSGYKVSYPQGLAVGGGFKDWFIQEFGRPAFTIEIGKGQNPLPLSDLPHIYSTLEEMLVLTFIM